MGQAKDFLIELIAELGGGDEVAARDFVLFGGRPEGLGTCLEDHWRDVEGGERRIEIQCAECGAYLGFAPLEVQYVTMADEHAARRWR